MTKKQKVVLAFLQNQYFTDPERIKDILTRHPNKRNYFIAQFLFMGCKTGKVLQQTLGQDLCRQIIWEEASPIIGSISNSAYPADPKHMRLAILQFKPEIIVTFGAVAKAGIDEAIRVLFSVSPEEYEFKIISGPHPTARMNPIPALVRVREQLLDLLS